MNLLNGGMNEWNESIQNFNKRNSLRNNHTLLTVPQAEANQKADFENHTPSSRL